MSSQLCYGFGKMVMQPPANQFLNKHQKLLLCRITVSPKGQMTAVSDNIIVQGSGRSASLSRGLETAE